MATITEDYVSFETAKLLKEKGFLQSTSVCNTVYKPNGYISNNAKSFIAPNYIYKDVYVFAPTLQMAIKWLREVHNLQIQIAPINSRYKDWAFGIYKDFSSLTTELICCPTYEDACETAVKYCLENLI